MSNINVNLVIKIKSPSINMLISNINKLTSQNELPRESFKGCPVHGVNHGFCTGEINCKTTFRKTLTKFVFFQTFIFSF